MTTIKNKKKNIIKKAIPPIKPKISPIAATKAETFVDKNVAQLKEKEIIDDKIDGVILKPKKAPLSKEEKRAYIVKKFKERRAAANTLKKKQKKRKIKKLAGRKIKGSTKIRNKKIRVVNNKLYYKINIRIKANNVFCILTKRKTNKELHSCTAGTYKIQTSKRKLKHTYLLILNKFFFDIRKIMSLEMKELKKKKKISTKLKPGIHIVISTPRYLRRKTMRSIKYHFRRRVRAFLIDIKDKKVFNGCRAQKKVRKKRRFRRIYK